MARAHTRFVTMKHRVVAGRQINARCVTPISAIREDDWSAFADFARARGAKFIRTPERLSPGNMSDGPTDGRGRATVSLFYRCNLIIRVHGGDGRDISDECEEFA